MNMKKTLLTILALMTVVVGANAQTVSSNAQKLSTKGAFIGMETTYRGLKTPEAGKVKPFAQPVAPQQKLVLIQMNALSDISSQRKYLKTLAKLRKLVPVRIPSELLSIQTFTVRL